LPEQDVQSFCCREDEKKMNSKEMNSKEMNNKEMANKEDHNRTRDERAARRSLLREAAEDNSAAESKKPRLDLLDMLSSSTTSVLDILTAAGRKPLPTTLSKDQIIKETGTGSRPGVLDIFDALAEDKEPAVQVVREEDSMEEEMFLDQYWFSGPPMEQNSIENEKEIFAIATTQEASSDAFPIVDEGFDVGFGFENAQAKAQAKDNNYKTRSRKVYLSPALVWLEEEGLPTAEREARAMEKAIGVEMDEVEEGKMKRALQKWKDEVEEGLMKRALQKWKMMGSEEKAVWRKRVEENANKKI